MVPTVSNRPREVRKKASFPISGNEQGDYLADIRALSLLILKTSKPTQGLHHGKMPSSPLSLKRLTHRRILISRTLTEHCGMCAIASISPASRHHRTSRRYRRECHIRWHPPQLSSAITPALTRAKITGLYPRSPCLRTQLSLAATAALSATQGQTNTKPRARKTSC